MSEAQAIVYATADDLIKRSAANRATAEDYILPSGAVVQVRGLSRAELLLSSKNEPDGQEYEARMVAYCLVNPRLSVAQVKAIQENSGPLELAGLTEKIRELSGLGEGADKSAV